MSPPRTTKPCWRTNGLNIVSWVMSEWLDEHEIEVEHLLWSSDWILLSHVMKYNFLHQHQVVTCPLFHKRNGSNIPVQDLYLSFPERVFLWTALSLPLNITSKSLTPPLNTQNHENYRICVSVVITTKQKETQLYVTTTAKKNNPL